MEESLRVVIYIPVPGSSLEKAIEPGSVVMPLGNPRPDGVRAVTWEARAFGERVPSTFADRAERAYARTRDHRNDLRKLVQPADLRPIGKLDVGAGEIELEWERDAEALAAWLGRPTLDPAELTTTRGVVVQMVRASVKEHGDQLDPQSAAAVGKHPAQAPAPAAPARSGGMRSAAAGGRTHWYSG